jgi:hypothetical protein
MAWMMDTYSMRVGLANKLNGFDRVWELAEQQLLSLRSAALVVAIREGPRALDARGIYP